jgi:hypothetical protein
MHRSLEIRLTQFSGGSNADKAISFELNSSEIGMEKVGKAFIFIGEKYGPVTDSSMCEQNVGSCANKNKGEMVDIYVYVG